MTTISHNNVIPTINDVNEITNDHSARTGEYASAITTLQSAIEIAADNIPAMETVRVVFSSDGYGIEYDPSLINESNVLTNLSIALGVLEQDMIASTD